MAFVMREMILGTSSLPGAVGTTYPWTATAAGFRSPADEGMADNDTTYFVAFNNASPPAYVEYVGTYRNTGGGARFERTTFLRSSTGADISWGTATVNLAVGLPGVVIASLINPSMASGYIKAASGTPPIFSSQAVPIPVADGGTNAITAADARTSLGALNRSLSEQTLLTGTGDLLYLALSGLPTRLSMAGHSTHFLRAGTTAPAWVAFTASMAALNGGAIPPYAANNVNDFLIELITYPKYSKTAQTTTQNINVATITALTDLDGLAIPGLGNSSKAFQVDGQVSLKNLGGGQNLFTVSVHLGSGGNTSDAVIAAAMHQPPNTGSSPSHWTIHIPPITFVPSTTDKITISTTVDEGGGSANYDVMTGTGQTFVVIKQITLS